MAALVYDAGALLAAERRNPDFLALHDEATGARIRPIVPVVVLAQAWRGGPQHQVSRVLKGCDILPDDAATGRADVDRAAGGLLVELHAHRAPIGERERRTCVVAAARDRSHRAIDREHMQEDRRRGRGDGLHVPPGYLFVMGDNRDNSSDSRDWGFVPLANVIGSPMFVYWSYDAPTSRWLDENLGHKITFYASIAGNFFSHTRWNRTGTLL